MKHPCGCVTEKKGKGVIIYPCRVHRQNEKWIWVALQHKEKK